MRKLAAHRIILSSGEVLRMHVVTLDDNGKVVEYHPLRDEEPFVEWHQGEFILN